MGKEEFRDFLYVKKSRLLVIVFSLIAIYIFTNILFKDNPKAMIYTFKVLMIVLSLSIILLSWATRRIEKNEFFKYIFYMYYVNILANLFMFFIDNYIYSNNSIYENSFKNERLLFLGIYFIFSRQLFKYLSGKKRWTKVDLISILLVSMYNLFFYYEIVRSEILIKIIFLFVFFISILNLKDILSFKLIIDDEINYIYIYAVLSFIKTGFQLINVFFNNIYIGFYFGIINFIILNMVSIIVTDKMINGPYNILFSKLFNTSNELKVINEEYLCKNKELEISQKNLRESEEVIKNLLKNLPIPLVIINYNSKRIIYANDLFLKIFNKKKLREIVNNKIFDFLDVEYKEIFNEDCTFNISRCFLKKSLTEKHIILEIFDKNKENGEIILSLNDITSKVKYNKIQDDIREKEFRQSIRRDFLSNISHDLKTPINVIYSSLQLEPLFIKNKDIESLKKYTDISKKNCKLLTSLANNIIDIGNISSEEIGIITKDVEFVSFTEDIVQSLIYYAKEKEIELLFDTNEEEVFIKIDKNAMNRVIVNIISNSIKFTPKNGKIMVEIIVEKGFVKLAIKDNGIGIEKDLLKDIFKRYKTTGYNKKITEKGSGIGLDSAKKLVQMQGGEISLKSEVGIGTEVLISLKREGV